MLTLKQIDGNIKVVRKTKKLLGDVYNDNYSRAIKRNGLRS